MSELQPPSGYREHPHFDPFEDRIGPLWLSDEGGDLRFAFRATDRHCNTGGTVHGGMLMTFADFALCTAGCWDVIETERCVTVSLNCDFVAAGREGDWIEARAEIVRRTRSMTFVRGVVTCDGRPLMTFSGVTRRFERQRE